MMEEVTDAALAVKRAPGCFGSPSVFSNDSKVCNTCDAFGSCRSASIETLQTIRQVINIEDLLALHSSTRVKVAKRIARPAPPEKPAMSFKPVKRQTTVAKVHFEISDDLKSLIAVMQNKKAQAVSVLLCKTGKFSEIVDALKHGKNPLTTPNYFRVACDMLISGGFTRESLKSQLMDELGWLEGSAAPHVSILVATLTGLKVAIEKSGHFSLNPDMG